MARVTFHGACGCVTGSTTLLEWGDTKVLVDCGLYQGPEELEARNRGPLPVAPHELSAVLVTHAHLDHTGLLPRLTKEGFQGPIYCSRPSRGLIGLLLEDSGEIQEEEARYARKKGYSRHKDPKPIYTARDAKATTRQLTPIPFGEERELAPGIRFRYRRAGHLLGAASIEVSAKGSDGQRRTWCFSGDIGRYDVPILHDPRPPEEAPEALLMESTYGDRRHVEERTADELRSVIRKTFGRGGSVIVPAFALGRSQEVLYHLSTLVDAGELSESDVFLDSPMAIDATEMYERARSEHDEDLQELIDEGANPLANSRFQRCRTVAQSKALNTRGKPAVIVAASGMATAGRVIHHLKQKLPDRRSTVLFVGYQAGGTRGRALVGGADSVAIHGKPVSVRAEIRYLRSLSAHADSSELLRWCEALPQQPTRLFLNHGDDPSRKALAALLEEAGWPRATLPMPGLSVPW